MKKIVLAIMITGIAVISAQAQDKVKYCKNAQTGEIITVQSNMPCPFPTHKI
jgi:hypothetical protein